MKASEKINFEKVAEIKAEMISQGDNYCLGVLEEIEAFEQKITPETELTPAKCWPAFAPPETEITQTMINVLDNGGCWK